MNFFWAGASMSFARYLTLATFCKLNPNWTVRLYQCHGNFKRNWNSRERQDFENYDGENYLELVNVDLPQVEFHEFKCPDVDTPVHASDIFQWEILKSGGWYSDMDILYLQPMDVATAFTEDADLVFSFPANGGRDFTIGFLGSSENRFYDDISKTAKQLADKNYQSAGVDVFRHLFNVPASNGAFEMLWRINKKYPDLVCSVLPTSWGVYPWNWRGTDQIFEYENPVKALGIHWYAGCPLSQQWNNKLTHENYTEFENTFCTEARKVMQ